MALSQSGGTRVTASGVVVRNDPGLRGLLCFNPFSGLVYAVSQDHATDLIKWLDRKVGEPPAKVYRSTVGAGWSTSKSEAVYLVPQLLPDRCSWPVVPSPSFPILINWFITGRCPLACKYCYAEDLMRNDALEPTTA